MYRTILFSCLFLLGCVDERIVSVPGPEQIIYVEQSALPLEFNIYASLNYDKGYYAIWWGDVKNTGGDTLKVFPQAKIFLSEETLKQNKPVSTTQGVIGLFNAVGAFEAQAQLLPGQTLQHYTKSGTFVIPENSGYINYLFSFLSR